MEQITAKETALWQKIFNYARGSQTEKEFLLSVKDEFSISEFSETKEPDGWPNSLYVAKMADDFARQLTNLSTGGKQIAKEAYKRAFRDICKRHLNSPDGWVRNKVFYPKDEHEAISKYLSVASDVTAVYFSPVPVSEVGQMEAKDIIDDYCADLTGTEEDLIRPILESFVKKLLRLPVPNTKTETKP